MLRGIKSPQRQTRALDFHVDGTGTASLVSGGDHGTLVDNGTGDYTITFTNPGARLLWLSGTPIGDNVTLTCNVDSTSDASSVTVNVVDEADTKTDADFYLLVLLSDAPDET